MPSSDLGSNMVAGTFGSPIQATNSPLQKRAVIVSEVIANFKNKYTVGDSLDAYELYEKEVSTTLKAYGHDRI